MATVTFRALVLGAVLAGATTAAEVVGRVGKHVSASRAALAGRRKYRMDERRPGRTARSHSPHQLAERGRRVLVVEELGRLAELGKITRVSRGVYGPPQPKLYAPSAAG